MRSTHVRLGFLTALAALCVLGVSSPADRAAGSVAAAKRPGTVLGTRSILRSGTELLRVDRRTFAPASRRRVALGPNHGAWALSPDGKHLAVGVERALGVRIVDVVRMRRVADVKTRNGQIVAAAWLTANRIVGVEATGVFVVDPVARRLVASSDLAGYPVGVGRTSDALVLLLAPTDELGFARLAVVDSEGRVRSVVLDRIRAGWRRWEDGELANEYQRPALAVDATGGRGFVVGGGARSPKSSSARFP